MTQCTEKTCPITNNMDITRSTPAEKKATAAALYATGKWTMENIAERLDVTKMTVSRWLVNCNAPLQSKPAKTDSNPKGAGRHKGSKKPRPHADEITAMRDAGIKATEIAATLGYKNERTVHATLREEDIKNALEPQIDPSSLSLTAQQKLAIAIKQQTRKHDAEFEQRVSAEVERRTKTAFPHLKTKQDRADKISASYTPRFSKKDCNAVARCLHSDTWQALNVPPELASRLKTAFITFTKMQNFLCIE